MFEFEHADALDRQHAVFERAGQPAVVYILRFGGVALHGAGDSATSDTPRSCEVNDTARLGGNTLRREMRRAPRRSV